MDSYNRHCVSAPSPHSSWVQLDDNRLWSRNSLPETSFSDSLDSPPDSLNSTPKYLLNANALHSSKKSLRDVEVCSVTTECTPSMPRSAPRLEVANYLSQHKYLESMEMERKSLQQQLQLVFMMYARDNRANVRPVGGVLKRHSRKRRPRKIKAHFLLSLMQYKQNLASFNQRALLLYSLMSHRYLETRLPLPKTFLWLTEILPNSPDSIFETHTRVTRRSFGMLLNVIETRASQFFKSRKGRKQIPTSIQLHLALFTLGYYGNGANFEYARAKFGYGVGTVLNARRRVVYALTSLTAEYIKWPDASERRELCAKVRDLYGYHSAFFAVDGTTHPFAFVPSYERNSWFDRKSRYSMQALVTNDVNLRVRHLVVGWPGSTHDARVLGSADYMLERNDEIYFDNDQHGLGDAAFGLHKRVVPNYKEPLASIPENTEYNRHHSTFRVKSEHTIGHVKNRFQGLKEVRLRMRTKKEVLEVVKYITAGYVLHNMLLDFKDEYRSTSNRLDRQEDATTANIHEDEDTVQEDLDSNCTAAQFREKVKNQVLTFIGYH